MATASPLVPRARASKLPERRPRVTLEGLLTHPDAFGLTTASPVQRAFCRAIDGIPLGALAEDPDVQWCFGGVEALRTIEAMALAGKRPREVNLVAAVRIGKTMLSSVIAFRAALLADLTGIRVGEEPVYSIMALNLDNAQVAINHLVGTVPHARLLRPHFLRSSKYTVTIRHLTTGRPIKIRAVAGKRAGGHLASRWSCGLTLDEFGKMLGQNDGVVNYDDCVRVIQARLRGELAQIFAPGSPWAPRGPAYKAVTEHHGKPTRALVVIRCRGPMANPGYYTAELIEQIRTSVNGELTLQTEVFAEFGDLPTQFFTGAEIDAATRPPEQLVVPYSSKQSYAAFIDPATRGNAWTLVVVGMQVGRTAGETLFEVALAHEWVGTKAAPLNPAHIFAEMATLLAPYRVTDVWSDQHNFDSNRPHAEAANITLKLDEATSADKASRYLAFKALVTTSTPEWLAARQAKQVSLPPDIVFRQDMLAIVKKLTPSAIKFPLPIAPDGRHADYAPSVAGAVAKAAEGSQLWSAAMQRLVDSERQTGMLPPVAPDAEDRTAPILRAARGIAELTIHQVAEKTGRDATMLALAEAGVVQVSEFVVEDVLKACGLPADWRPPRN
jgi:hypothetical protein